jgi:dolichyl-phosphate-mannose-protein mannosyltransferase
VPARARVAWGWLGLGACLLLAFALRAPFLGTTLGKDEAGIAFIARQWGSGHGSLYGSYWVDRPPLLIALFKVAALGGDVGVRLLGAVAALAIVAGVVLLARAVAGERAGLIAGLLAALLTGSAALTSVYTPGELIAAVPSTFSIFCLVLAHRSRRTGLMFAAGLLAIAAVLVKQSFLDAGFAGLVFLIASGVADRGVRARWWLAYSAGVAIPLAALLLWQVAAQLPDGGIVYALVGFRIDGLHTLAGSDIPLGVRLKSLEDPVTDSRFWLVVALAVLGLTRLRGDRVVMATLGAWLVGATIGVLGGGSYWPHYLIELIPVCCVAAAAGIVRSRALTQIAVVGACAVALLLGDLDGITLLTDHPQHARAVEVGHFVRDHARPGDTQYVMYAQANAGYYTGLPSPYPYAWSLMVRAKPGAIPQLRRLLASPQRPTWVVEFQDIDNWGLDPQGRTRRLIERGYWLAAVVRGQPIYLRNDRNLESPR